MFISFNIGTLIPNPIIEKTKVIILTKMEELDLQMTPIIASYITGSSVISVEIGFGWLTTLCLIEITTASFAITSFMRKIARKTLEKIVGTKKITKLIVVAAILVFETFSFEYKLFILRMLGDSLIEIIAAYQSQKKEKIGPYYKIHF